jgi:hypothetical protein
VIRVSSTIGLQRLLLILSLWILLTWSLLVMKDGCVMLGYLEVRFTTLAMMAAMAILAQRALISLRYVVFVMEA